MDVMEIIASAPSEMERVCGHDPARHSQSAPQMSQPGAPRDRAGAPQGWHGVTSRPAPQKKGHPTPVSQKLSNLGFQQCPVPQGANPADPGGGRRPHCITEQPAQRSLVQHPKNPWDTREVANSHRRVPEPTGHESSKIGR